VHAAPTVPPSFIRRSPASARITIGYPGILATESRIHVLRSEPNKGLDATDMPRRLQIRRSKGWRLPANTVKVDRSTLFGNPFLAIEHGHERAVALYRAWIAGRRFNARLAADTKKSLARRRQQVLRALPSLRGKNLACWCPLPRDGEPDKCHGAVLLALANR
jgi:Domain of unknown function (DUF4326)